MNFKIIFSTLIQYLIIKSVNTKEIELECDISESHFTKNSCSFTTTTCIIEQFRDFWDDNIKLIFTNSRDENFTSIVFQNCYIPIFPKELFEQFSNLESIDLSSAGITRIKEGKTFINGSELIELNLANNGLTEIAGLTFKGAENLKSLDLSNNRINVVSIKAFDVTPKLEYLNLCHNLIQIIKPEMFKVLKNLRTVFLYRNSIIDVNPQSFAYNNQLNTLDLNSNVLREVELELSSPRLNKLDLSNCSLDELTLRKSSNIDGNLTIRYLNVFHNELNNISQIRVDKAIKLQNLDLSNNHLRSLNIPPEFIQDLNVLKLNDNHLWEISTGFLNKFGKLRALYLNKNDMRLYDSMFKYLSNLKILSLADNRMKKLDLRYFEGLSNLTQLNLENNLLVNFNYTTLSNILPSIELLLIDNNLFRCQFLHEMMGYVRNKTEGRTIEFTNEGLNKEPSCVPDDQQGETYWIWIVIGLIFVTFVILMIVLRQKIFERWNQIRRRLRSYSNMRETDHSEHAQGPLADRSED
uniref:CSON013327 protein n=1 Tax=Culicoides sonorensis TaxID=179676 RepID=A0A336M7N8_CULSO